LEVVETLGDALDPRELRLAVAQRARDLLRGVRVVPEIGSTGLLAEVRNLRLESLDAHHGADVGETAAQGGDVIAQVKVDHGPTTLFRAHARRLRDPAPRREWASGVACQAMSSPAAPVPWRSIIVTAFDRKSARLNSNRV